MKSRLVDKQLPHQKLPQRTKKASPMENRKVFNNVPKKKKCSKQQLSAKYKDNIDLKKYRRSPTKPSSIGPKSNGHEECLRHSVYAKKHVEKTNYNIEKMYQIKEDKLLNLIVRIIVTSTLEQLYGKEGY